MDLTDSLAAKSDQLNAVDLAQPRTFTIEKITAGSADQPFDFHLVEMPGHPYRPSKGMRRVIARGWGEKNIGDRYPGRRLTLFCNPDVLWAGAPVGGIQVSHMSHIDQPFTMPLRISQKKTVQYTVEPLRDEPSGPSAADVAACEDVAVLRSWWQSASPDLRRVIESRVRDLSVVGGAQGEPPTTPEGDSEVTE